MRAPGEAQMLFAVESHTDFLAAQMKMDPIEFRYRNLLKRGDRLPYGVRLEYDKARQLLKRVAKKIGWNGARKRQPYVGQGLAFCIREIGIGEANVEVGLKDDGRVYLVTTVPDAGTGAHTILRQMAAETLGVAADDVEIIVGTTDHFPTDVAVAGSRVTYLAGQASQKAAGGLRDLLLNEAAETLRCRVERLRFDKRFVRNGAKQKISLAELAARSASTGRKLQVKANFKIQKRGGTACFSHRRQRSRSIRTPFPLMTLAP